jgi:hypothetical protein
VNSASISDCDAEKMLVSSFKDASIFILRTIARLTKALGYAGHDFAMSSKFLMAESIVSPLDSLDARRTMSLCSVSRIDSCEEEMVGCGGNEASIDDASLDFATDDGRVSGSKSAFKIRASLADSEVLAVSTAIVVRCGRVVSIIELELMMSGFWRRENAGTESKVDQEICAV